MSKSVVATLPGGILVALWWQRGRLSWKADVLPVVPFFLIGAGAGMVTAWWELAMNGCRGPEFVFTSVQRLFIAGHSLWFELGKLFWPVNLTFIYPRWEIGTHALRPYLYPLGWAALVLGLWLLRHYSRAPLAAVLFYCGTLVPVLGFFNLYTFKYAFTADHYQYLACLGIFTLLAAGAAAVFRRLTPPQRATAQGMVAALVLLLAVLTWRQARIYADNETLFAPLSSGIPRALWPTIIWPWPCSARTQRRGAPPSATGRGPEARRGREPQQPRLPVGQPRADRRGHCPVRGRAGDRPRQRRGPLPPGQSAGQAGPVGRGHRPLPGGFRVGGGRREKRGFRGKFPRKGHPGAGCGQRGGAQQPWPAVVSPRAIRRGRGPLPRGPGAAAPTTPTRISRWAWSSFRKIGGPKRWPSGGKGCWQPQSLNMLNLLARLLATDADAAIRNGREAVDLAQRAAQLTQRRDPQTLDTLAAAYAEAGRFAAAVQTAQEALSLPAAVGDAEFTADLRHG